MKIKMHAMCGLHRKELTILSLERSFRINLRIHILNWIFYADESHSIIIFIREQMSGPL